ncbi:MAG: tRNA (adenosine(37)-N6)-threonylcarbamoyltransferase complex ATPase subunit type 1 TsaE [Candidatus Sumerlaeaceae bacterium]
MPFQTVLKSNSPAETASIAAALASVLRGGEYISLEGDLGAGKTLFAGALIHALGVTIHVTSPTFVLQKEYETPGGLPVSSILHYDFYRIQTYAELLDLGFEDTPDHAVVVAEWGDKFVSNFPGNVIRVLIAGCGEDTRTLVLHLSGASQNAQFAQALKSVQIRQQEP